MAERTESDWTYFAETGNWYKAVGDTLPFDAPAIVSWVDANADAQARGVHLVDIHSAAENAFVQNLALSNDPNHGHWIGLYQPPGSPEPDGGWQWTTGAPVTFTNWGGRSPSNNGGSENHAQLIGNNPSFAPDKWNDYNGTDTGAFPWKGGYVLEKTGGVPTNPVPIPRPVDPETRIYELGIEVDRFISAGLGYNFDIVFDGTPLEPLSYFDIEDNTATLPASFPGKASIGIEAKTGGLIDTALGFIEPLEISIPGTPSYEIKAGPDATFGAIADVYEADGQWYMDIQAGAGVGLPVNVNLGLVPGIGVLDAVLPDEVYDQLTGIGFELGTDGFALTSLPVDLSSTPGPGSHGIGLTFSGFLLLSLDTDANVFLREADAGFEGPVISEDSLYESIWDLLPISVPQLTSDTGVVNFTSDGLTMQTGSPVWTSLVVDIVEDSNAMNFDFEFLSGVGAEGLLQVYIDGVLVGTIDERFVEGEGSSTVFFDELLAGETAEVSFRLDSYTEVDSLIDLSNISFGYSELAVPEPSSIFLLATGIGLLARRRRAA